MDKFTGVLVLAIGFGFVTESLAQRSPIEIRRQGELFSESCVYLFEPGTIPRWSGQGQPPITLENVAQIVSNWTSNGNLNLAEIHSYHLATMRPPLTNSPLQAWFVEFSAMPQGTFRGRFAYGEALHALAITLDGTVVVPECS